MPGLYGFEGSNADAIHEPPHAAFVRHVEALPAVRQVDPEQRCDSAPIGASCAPRGGRYMMIII